MAHLPTTEEQWGHWAEQAPTLPDPVVPETATQFSQRLDNFYAEYRALRRAREARGEREQRAHRIDLVTNVATAAELARLVAHQYEEIPFSDNYLQFRDLVMAQASNPTTVHTSGNILYQSSSGMIWENFSFPAKAKQPKQRVFNRKFPL